MKGPCISFNNYLLNMSTFAKHLKIFSIPVNILIKWKKSKGAFLD